MKSEIQIKNSAGVCRIEIEGTIGVPEEWQFDQPEARVATYEKFLDTVRRIAGIDAPQIVCDIRSTGGDVNDALLIHDALCSLDAHITTRCYGYTASAATIIAQAASPGCREISANALYLIHTAICAAEGNAAEIAGKLDLLRQTDTRIAAVYAARSGRPAGEFEALMAEETFDDITVNELCARALIRRPTFYSHFEDKYDFLRFYLNEIQWQIESEADAATDSPVEQFPRSWRARIAFIDERPARIRMGLRSKSLPIIFEIISEHIFASSSRRVRAYCGAVTDSPELADTLATFTVGGLIQNLKRYLTEPNLDPDALTAEMTTVFEPLWNSFTSEAV